MKPIFLLSVLVLSGCSSTADGLYQQYEAKRRERRLEQIENQIDRLIKAQQITSDAVDFALQQMHELRHENDKPMDKVDKFDI